MLYGKGKFICLKADGFQERERGEGRRGRMEVKSRTEQSQSTIILRRKIITDTNANKKRRKTLTSVGRFEAGQCTRSLLRTFVRLQLALWLGHYVQSSRVFTCVSYAEARLSYRLDVCPSVCHTLVLCRNGSTYRQTVFTTW